MVNCWYFWGSTCACPKDLPAFDKRNAESWAPVELQTKVLLGKTSHPMKYQNVDKMLKCFLFQKDSAFGISLWVWALTRNMMLMIWMWYCWQRNWQTVHSYLSLHKLFFHMLCWSCFQCQSSLRPTTRLQIGPAKSYLVVNQSLKEFSFFKTCRKE